MDLEMLLNGPPYWYWLAGGVLLIALEIMVPGAFLIWLGLAAIITALATVIAPDMALTYQILIFAGLSVVTVLTGRRWMVRLNERSEQPLLNRRGEQYIGQRYTLDKPIRDGSGRLRVGDSTWVVRGPDLPAGAHVRVTAIDGATMVVERVD
ncbi:MAG: NfeD family protein [Alphaproteobacteria bacterium]